MKKTGFGLYSLSSNVLIKFIVKYNFLYGFDFRQYCTKNLGKWDNLFIILTANYIIIIFVPNFNN